MTFRNVFSALQLGLALVIGLAPTAPARAQTEPDAPRPAEEATADATAPAGPETPRGAMLGYLKAARAGDFEAAARFLDLSPVPAAERAERGPTLARQLKAVLDRELWVDLGALSDQPEGQRDDGLPARRDRVGEIETERGATPILLDRRTQEDGEGEWRIAATTVAEIPNLWDEYGYGPLAEWLPESFFRSDLFDVQLWQWLALLLLLPVVYLAAWLLVQLVFGWLVQPFAARSDTDLDDQVVVAARGPVRLLLTLLFFHAGVTALTLSAPAYSFLVNVEKTLSVVAITWLLLRGADVLADFVEHRLVRTHRATATSLVPLGRKSLKTAVVLLAVLAALDTAGFDVTAVIAGLGVGGLAIALAAQKTLENLFGGATLLADRPVRVGDFCRFGDRVGTVEEIGLRSTRVRTLDRTLVTVANAEFATLQLENFGARDRILYRTTIGLRYETSPNQLRFVLTRVKQMLTEHEHVAEDPARIRFVGFGASSLDLEIFAYVLTSDYNRYLEIAEDLNLRLMDIVEDAGSGFAFPSTTAYLAKDDGLDTERARAAEASINPT